MQFPTEQVHHRPDFCNSMYSEEVLWVQCGCTLMIHRLQTSIWQHRLWVPVLNTRQPGHAVNIMRFMLMTLIDSGCKVKMQNDVSWSFRVHHFGRHTRASCSISILKVTRSININHKEILFASNTNYLAYASDINFFNRNPKVLKRSFCKVGRGFWMSRTKDQWGQKTKVHGDAAPR